MMDTFSPAAALERSSKPLLRVFALLVLLVSLWGMVNLLAMRGRSIRVALGTAAAVQEERQGDAVRYYLPFTEEETGAEMIFRLHNNSPVLDYLLTSPPTHAIAVRYWPDDMSVVAVNPFLPDVPPISYPTPSRGLLLGTSVLGLVVASALLLPDLLGRFVYQSGRRASQS
jgi:hypothetical protein